MDADTDTSYRAKVMLPPLHGQTTIMVSKYHVQKYNELKVLEVLAAVVYSQFTSKPNSELSQKCPVSNASAQMEKRTSMKHLDMLFLGQFTCQDE